MSASTMFSQLAPRAVARSSGGPLPLAGGPGFAASARVWLVLVAFLAVVQLFITFVGAGLERDPRVGLFAWPMIGAFGLAGLVGIWFSHRTGFPAAWGGGISKRQRLLVPALLGAILGLAPIGVDLAWDRIRVFVQLTGIASFNAPFPGSLLFSPGGAILVEVYYRLLAIPVMLWLISNVALRGRAEAPVFWALAVLTLLVEPLSQNLFVFQAGFIGLAVAQGLSDFAHNLVQAAMFRRYGFLAAIVTRVAMYLVWHVAYGNFICQC